MTTSVFVRQGGLGEGATLTLMIVLLILARIMALAM